MGKYCCRCEEEYDIVDLIGRLCKKCRSEYVEEYKDRLIIDYCEYCKKKSQFILCSCSEQKAFVCLDCDNDKCEYFAYYCCGPCT